MKAATGVSTDKPPAPGSPSLDNALTGRWAPPPHRFDWITKDPSQTLLTNFITTLAHPKPIIPKDFVVEKNSGHCDPPPSETPTTRHHSERGGSRRGRPLGGSTKSNQETRRINRFAATHKKFGTISPLLGTSVDFE